MFKAKRGSVRFPDAKVMAAALEDIRTVQSKYDARLMWLLLLDRAALVARQLKALEMETDDSIELMFQSALAQAKMPMKVPPKTFNPDAQPTGQPS